MKHTKLLLTLALMLTACAPVQLETPSITTPTSAPTSATVTVEEIDSLAGTQWLLTSFGTPGAETEAMEAAPITLEFSEDGQVMGNGGCNTYTGTYLVDGAVLRVGEVVSTLLACVDEDAMAQEIAYFDALQLATSYALADDSLTIFYTSPEAGEGQLDFTRVQDSESTESAPLAPDESETATPEPEANTGSTPGSTSAPDAGADVDPERRDFVWHCYGCSGNQLWEFEDGIAQQVEIPVDLGVYYDYTPATDRILYGPHFPTQGAGPGTVAVTDLWTFDMESEESQPIFNEERVVEAFWAPDGEHIAYILATENSYELRWLAPDGTDTLLATDVAFTLSVSPDGEQIAFTRESNYGVDGEPGLYVVNTTTGEEQILSDVDRAGRGSIEDQPAWSPSGTNILLSTQGMEANPDLLRAATDGSDTVAIQFDPALAGEEWYNGLPYSPFWTEENQFIGSAFIGGENMQMGGDAALVLYQLNDALDTIVAGEVLAQGRLIGWDVPGSSVWVQVGSEMQSIPLPEL